MDSLGRNSSPCEFSFDCVLQLFKHCDLIANVDDVAIKFGSLVQRVLVYAMRKATVL